MNHLIRTSVRAGLLALSLSAACSPQRIAFSPVCEIAVRDIQKSTEIKRIRDRALIDEITRVLSAPRDRLSAHAYGYTLPSGRYNLLFFACAGPVEQLAIGPNFLVSYHAQAVYALAPHEREILLKLLVLRF